MASILHEIPRRTFLKQTALLLAGVSAGTLTWQGCSSSQETLASSNGGSMSANAAVSFGWEVQLNNNGANVYFAVTKNMLLLSAEIDTSLMILSPPAAAGFLEVLCQASVSRGTAPKFSASTGPAYLPVVTSSDFGSVNLVNPNNLVSNFNDSLAQDVFYSVILKHWAPLDGTASSTARHVNSEPSLPLSAGDYLVFHMDHAGVPCDSEMQVVLTYALT